jgi:hypothetical protein
MERDGMSLLDWFRKGHGAKEDPRLRHWKQEWTSAIAAPEAARLQKLGADLEAFGLPEDDIEIEREMLEGLERLIALTHEIGANGLPVVDTGHRVVGTERCHFSAPASMPDEPTQPSGRLLLTSGRAIFVGGASARTLAWHMVGDALPSDRDLVLVRVDREHLLRFRSNTFADALCAAFLARRLMGSHRRVL